MRYNIESEKGYVLEREEYYEFRCPKFLGGSMSGKHNLDYHAVGLTKKNISRLMQMRDLTKLGQAFGILPVELERTTSVHQGTMRECRVGKNGNADSDKFVLVMHPTAECSLNPNVQPFKIVETTPPSREVFVALLTKCAPNSTISVDFWMEHWNWVDSDASAPQFPANFHSRYERPCIWIK